jgi:hypothetical protein
MIGGFFQGMFGKKDADITDTVYFDVAVDGSPVGEQKHSICMQSKRNEVFFNGWLRTATLD